MGDEQASTPDEAITLKEALENIPPGKAKAISEKVHTYSQPGGLGPSFYIPMPVIQLYCGDQACEGLRFFIAEASELWLKASNGINNEFITYTCKHCSVSTKTFALCVMVKKDKTVAVAKIGELPPFGPPTPSRVLSLIGPDRDTFLKGRRSESQGLGIGAFSYYRRIVETHKDRIFDELIKVCKKTDALPELIAELEQAKKETRFAKAVESIKHTLPAALLIKGHHNPLTLLHNALSEGLHDHSDEECLDLAQSIRVVLAEFAERVSQILKEEKELDTALAKLMKGANKKKPGAAVE
jgi:hypothetical protein